MATATSSPPYEPDPFDLGIYTPKNLARVALTRMCNAAIAEGQQLDEFPALPTTVTQPSPIDITDAANQLVDEQVAAYNAKPGVFRTFCAHFNEAAREFTIGLERDFAKHFSSSVLEFWKQTLANTNCASAPTYNSIATVSPIRSSTTTSSVYPQPLPTATHRPRATSTRPSPRRPRVFVRLAADAPARNHIGYAIRAHITSKTGLKLNKIPQVVQVNTGWAIRSIDKTTRDLLLER
jgi:hypothetical protein